MVFINRHCSIQDWLTVFWTGNDVLLIGLDPDILSEGAATSGSGCSLGFIPCPELTPRLVKTKFVAGILMLNPINQTLPEPRGRLVVPPPAQAGCYNGICSVRTWNSTARMATTINVMWLLTWIHVTIDLAQTGNAFASLNSAFAQIVVLDVAHEAEDGEGPDGAVLVVEALLLAVELVPDLAVDLHAEPQAAIHASLNAAVQEGLRQVHRRGGGL